MWYLLSCLCVVCVSRYVCYWYVLLCVMCKGVCVHVLCAVCSVICKEMCVHIVCALCFLSQFKVTEPCSARPSGSPNAVATLPYCGQG